MGSIERRTAQDVPKFNIIGLHPLVYIVHNNHSMEAWTVDPTWIQCHLGTSHTLLNYIAVVYRKEKYNFLRFPRAVFIPKHR